MGIEYLVGKSFDQQKKILSVSSYFIRVILLVFTCFNVFLYPSCILFCWTFMVSSSFFLNCIDAHCVLWITACALFILHSLTYSSYQNCWPIVYYIWRHRACPTKFADKSFFCKPMQFILGHVLLKLLTNLFFLQTYAIRPRACLTKIVDKSFFSANLCI